MLLGARSRGATPYPKEHTTIEVEFAAFVDIAAGPEPVKWIVLAALAAFALYALMCCILYVMQGRLLYFPTPEARPVGATAVLIHSGELALKVWQLHGDLPDALIYFGGNAEDVAAKITEFAVALPDRAIYLVHYRGYGGNAGTPSEKLLVADAQAIYDDIKRRHERVAVMGRSLGSGVATAVAATRPVEKVILVTPYDSIINVAADHYGWAPVRWLIKDSYDSVRRMKGIHAPVLAVIAARDDVVFRPRSEALVAAIPASLRHVKVFPDAAHNDINLQPGYRELLREFLAAP
jgi:pimeloyl-ACP methyl ester carboxylesterase